MSDHRSSVETKVETPHAVILFTLLGRLKLFFALVQESLRTEYVHDSRTVDDWLYTIEWLEDSLFPIHEFFRRGDVQDALALRKKANRFESFKTMLMDAKKVLVASEIDPVKKLFGLLDAVVGIHGGLARWQRELAPASQDCTPDLIVTSVRPPFPSLAPSAVPVLSRLMEEFVACLVSKDETNTCLKSRKIFLLLYYTIAVRPEEWYARLHQQILRLHEAAVRELPPGDASESIEARRRILADYNAERFMRDAGVVEV